ncbi:sensor histidine kinase [Pontibacter korlensis]
MGILKELILVFLFLLSTFWMHEHISRFFSSKLFPGLPSYLSDAIEAATVIAVCLLLCLVVVYIPTYVLYPEMEILPIRVRIGTTVGAIISLFFYYFVQRHRERKQLQEEFIRSEQLQKESFKAQLETLKTQVNPHFLFNSLNILNSLIYKNQNQAAQFLEQLSEVYRALLDNGQKTLVSLQTELKLAEAYMYLMKTRFGSKVEFHLDVPQERMHLSLPPTSLQMLLENAIKHNGSTAQRPLHIHIYTSEEALVVQNNLQPRLEEVKSTQLGLENIKKRYAFLTDREVEIIQNEDEFIVKLPLLKIEQYENSYHRG